MSDGLPPAAGDDELTDTAIPGDGVVTIETPIEEHEMPAEPIDLPPNVAAELQLESVGNIQANNRDGRNVGTIAMGVLQAAAARNFDELGVTESRATSGVIATPVASPTTQSGA